MRALLSAVVLLIGTTATLAQPGPPPRSVWDAEGELGDGFERETTLVKQGQAAARWRGHPEQAAVTLAGVPSDWSGYNRLRLWLHSARAVPTRVMMIIASENEATEGMDYWGFPISLSFEGWKELVVPLDELSAARVPRGWDQIDSLSFTAAGWGNIPHPEAEVVIDDVRLGYEPPTVGPRLSDAEFFERLDLDRPDLAAVQRAVQAGDLEAAKAAFLEHLRARETPRWWFDWRTARPEQPVTGGSDGWDYYATSFAVDWTGWKRVELPLQQFGRSREPIGWHHITRLGFSATYGDRTPSAETVLVLDEMQLVGDDTLLLNGFETPADVATWGGLTLTRDTVREGAAAARWANLPVRGSTGTGAIPRDWTPYRTLAFWAWSAAPTGDRITVTADSDTPNVDAAEGVMRHMKDGYHLGDDIDWEANKRDPADPAFTPEWTYNLNRFGHWQTLADAYRATGDEKYAREWIAQMRDWVEDNPYPLLSNGNNTLTWRTIEAGIRTAYSWPDVLYSFLGSPSLSPDDAVMFLKSWMEHGDHLMRINRDFPEHGGNWVTMEMNGLGHLGILFPEADDADAWLDAAVTRMTQELGAQVYPDGAQKELTTGYHQVARLNFVKLLQFAHLNDVPMPESYLARLEALYDYNLKAMQPDGQLPPLNDAGYTGVIESLAEGAELFGRDDFLWAATAGAQGTPPEYGSIALPYAGQYIMRSGWDPGARYLLFDAGPYGTGHQHEDKLSLVISAFGRPLLTEGGNYSYDRSKWRRWVLGTWAHNTILVDGQEQHRNGLGATYTTPEPLDNLWFTTPTFDVADGVYDSGYGPKREIAVRHERKVVFVKPDYWLVVDRLHADGPHRYDILWHLEAENAEHDGLAAWGTTPNAASLLVTPAAQEDGALALDIVKGREEPVLGWSTGARYPIPTLNYQRQAAGSVTLAWVLTPFEGERPAVSATVSEVDGGTIVTVERPGGTDRVYLAPRGDSRTVRLGGREVTGEAVVLREDAAGRVTALQEVP